MNGQSDQQRRWGLLFRRGSGENGAGTSFSKDRALWLSQHVLRHEPALRAWLVRHMKDIVDVDDVVQESYATLMSIEQVGHIDNPRNYLFTVAKSIVLQGLRRARVVSIESVGEIERLEIAGDGASPESHAAAIQELRQLEHSIARLPTKCREVFLLRKMRGMAQREIAERMGLSESTVEKHIVKALKYLGQALAADGTAAAAGKMLRFAKKERQHEE